MSQNQPRDDWNWVVGKIRPSQLITTFGPGSVVDLPDDSVMISGIDTWKQGEVVHENRLERALQVGSFRSPPIRQWGGDIPCKRFPRMQVCSNLTCGRLSRQPQCPDCHSRTYPARIIVICAAGHADDFPWGWWVHRGQHCHNPVLRLRGSGRSATLSDLVLSCDSCERTQSLSGALGPLNFPCRGYQPWLKGSPSAQCDEPPRAVLRGASNVYFSSIYSALSIPPWSNPLQVDLNNHWETLRHLPDETLPAVIPSLPGLRNYALDEVLQAIRERRHNTATISSLRQEEFQALCHPPAGIGQTDFEILEEPLPANFTEYLEQVVLAYRLREVKALKGFTRIDPPDNDNVEQELAPIFLVPQNWLPAIEQHGEGIFMRLNQQELDAWEQKDAVQRRVAILNQTYDNWRAQRNLPPSNPRLPRYILLHTLAHLLIRQLSLECGYSSTSLRERIYADDKMAGLLIYTASADSDGSLGGLVLQGKAPRLNVTLRLLLDDAQWCSSDPLCSEHDPRLTSQLNGAACHACSLVSETSCEQGNRFLDRALVCDLHNVSGTGFFS